MSKETVYIALRDRMIINTNVLLTIKDLGQVFCNNKAIEDYIGDIEIYKSPAEENWDYIDADYIINKAVGYNPSVDINMIGATEVLLEIKSREKERKIFQFIKVTFILIVLFFGSGIAIINFHEDVNMTQSLEKIYYSFTGVKKTRPLIMTIPYSIGLGVGIIGFFNRVVSSSHRRKKEPGPMELESYLYDRDMDQYILDDLKKKDDKT